MSLQTIIVGSHFSPPAKTILKALASGTPVELQPEPENPYDANAIRVFVEGTAIDAESLELLSDELAGSGFSVEEVIGRAEPWPLGHVAASGGKPLAKAIAASGLELVGTLEVGPRAADGGRVSFVGELAVVTLGED